MVPYQDFASIELIRMIASRKDMAVAQTGTE